MKTIKFPLLLVGLALIIGLTDCNKLLNEVPVSTASPSTFWKDKNDASTWMAGIYNQLQTTLSSNYLNWGEVRSDNLEVGGTGNAQLTMMTNTLSANNSNINGITQWQDLYTTISLCNYGIHYLPGMIAQNLDGGTADYKDDLGQCYGLRALMYFYGIRVWGRMVIHKDPIENITQPLQVGRSSVDSVKALILSDIDSALATIGSDNTKKYYMQKAAVYALQTDVYMWFQDYNNALIASTNFMKTTNDTWVKNISDWKAIFTDPSNSTETVFNLFWSSVERGGGCGICSLLGSSSNTNQYEPTDLIYLTLKNHIDSTTGKVTDGRYWANFDTVTYLTQDIYDKSVVQLGKFYPWKITPTTSIGSGFVFEGTSNCSAQLPIYRYAGVMLLRAEALNQTGNYQAALDIVNAVRGRVGYNVVAKLSDYSGDVTAGIQTTILDERQIELVGEGKRWFDLERIGNISDFSDNSHSYLRQVMNPILANRTGGITYEGANMGRILFPLNSNEFNANLKLVGDQNPPYDE